MLEWNLAGGTSAATTSPKPRHFDAMLQLQTFRSLHRLVSSTPRIPTCLLFVENRRIFHRKLNAHHLAFASHAATRMASDEAYSAFLDQANQDTGAAKASTESTSAATKATDTDVPVSLQKVEQYYVSEADEPFEPVSLKWNGSNMPSESKLAPPSPSL